MPETSFAPKLEDNATYLKQLMGVGESYDALYKEFQWGGHRIGVFVVNGFFQDFVLLQTLEQLMRSTPLDLQPSALESILHSQFSFVQVEQVDDLERFVFFVLSGAMGMIVDGIPHGIVIDTRYYPDRLPEEPQTERVIRGPQDAFVENILDNTTLVRRRLREPRLRNEMVQVGTRSKMDVAICYIKGLANDKLVELIKQRLQASDVCGVPMAERAVEEIVTDKGWNPFPIVRYTERPDVVAEFLLEGHVAVLTDTTPEAFMLPASYFHHIHHPEDYHLNPINGTFMRWIVLLSLWFSTLLPAVWLLAAVYHIAPPWLSFLGPKKSVEGFTLPLQFLIAEIGIDMVRRAILNSPKSMAQAMSIFAAVVFGSVATETGFFTSETLLYMAIAAMATFATSSLELAMANRMVRILFILLVWAFSWVGLVVGVAAVFIMLVTRRSFGLPYLWPLIPFDWEGITSILVRRPLIASKLKPSGVARFNP